MLIDRKREEMYFNCRMRKKKLDNQHNIVKAAMIIPPAFMLISVVIDIIMLMLSDIAILASGALFYGYDSKGASLFSLFEIIMSSGLLVLAICITIFRADFMLKYSTRIYGGIALALVIVIIAMNNSPIIETLPFIIYTAITISALVLSLVDKKLYKEDLRMSTLDGYPHFNSNLMPHTDVPVTPVTKEDLDGMTPDERIMYEREHYF